VIADIDYIYESVMQQSCGFGFGTHLFVKKPRPGDSEVTFWSSSQAATCYYQFNHSKVEAILLSALPKGQNKRTCRPYQYQIFKSLRLTRPGNRTLPTTWRTL